MAKVTLYTSEKAVSLKKVTHHLGRVIEQGAGAEVRYVYGPDLSDENYADADAVVVVMPFDVVWIQPYFYIAWRAWYIGKPYAFYTTIEGDVRRTALPFWVIRDLTFVANSEYTRDKIHSVGARVVSVVYHGADVEAIAAASERGRRLRERLLRGGRRLVGYVASGHRRKCHDLFSRAVKEVSSKNKDIRFVVVTDEKGAKYYEGTGAAVLQRFGQMTEDDIYALFHALDVYVQASCAEGFGMPLLEALLAGKRVVVPDYRPLTEFVREEDASIVPVSKVEMVDEGGGIIYELNRYEPADMAEAVLDAVDRVERGETVDRSYYVERFDYRKVYSWFLAHLGLG